MLAKSRVLRGVRRIFASHVQRTVGRAAREAVPAQDVAVGDGTMDDSRSEDTAVPLASHCGVLSLCWH